MESNKRISELLVETKAYTDLEKPVILTSGELGIYYINTEKLCQDGGKFKEYGEDSKAMIGHAIKMTEEHPTFKEVIDILSEDADKIFSKIVDADCLDSFGRAISGGQRRDWLFSGPVAKNLGISHASLYKDGKIEVLNSDGEIDDTKNGYGIAGLYTLHISDLLTKGSSAYRKEDEKELGWIPMLKNGKAYVSDLATVVTRLQGGEEMLAKQNIKVHPYVAIDEDFLKQHSTNSVRAFAYAKDPSEWSMNYLTENGALALLGTFDPNGGKLDRAKKFLTKYYNVLKESKKMFELEKAVQEKYSKSLNEIVEK